ncbi:hypothetical protein ACN42_g4674 [Penicillium freii]|uniref:Uncharacterized protein n=1 Tax=Penicillium freii TaxID=48697 RepID=A0A101MKZ0_PENFR|nr:hypothetical protein ACN42_g4674 [Penicillium freii]
MCHNLQPHPCRDKKGKESGVYSTPATWITNAGMEVIKLIVNNVRNRLLEVIRAQLEEGTYAGCWFVAFLAFLVKKYRPKKTREEEEAKERLTGEVDKLPRRVEELEVGLKGQMAVLEEKLEAGRGYL